ncbi:AbiH family protein [Streptococcus sp. NLN76]|uniref:AbiH family protein n=1 Tax=Streptococcus sp. NLN76 TaxID=2822800 RepID=UPI0018ABBDF4|nr:AbiH family protein [Streptococcus sp. NLN76]MBF8971147.1 bacteriophage abortive infection AbiH family protein [Streptococcus sp. NLN76]
MKKKLFIIGNGFDLAHDLPTRYNDFKKWILKQIDPKRETLFVTAEQDYFWNDFQIPQTYTSSDGEEIFRDNDIQIFFISLINQLVNGSDWTDFESKLGDIADLSIDCEDMLDKDGDIDHFKNQYYLQDLNDSLIKAIPILKNTLFPNWVRSIMETEEYSNLSALKQTIMNDSNNFFLTFNYTEVLEEVYGISPSKICHIHGSIEEDRFLYGHGEKVFPEDVPEFYIGLEHALLTLQNEFKKPVSKQLSVLQSFLQNVNTASEIKEIYFIGISAIKTDIDEYPGVDDPYFEKIFELMPNVDIYVDEHERDSELNIKKKLKKRGARKADQLQFINTDTDTIAN